MLALPLPGCTLPASGGVAKFGSRALRFERRPGRRTRLYRFTAACWDRVLVYSPYQPSKPASSVS